MTPKSDIRTFTAATAISRETSRNVEFLNTSDFESQIEICSDMWWQNRTVFLSRGDRFESIQQLEQASFATFQMHTRKNDDGGGVRLTQDWLDMSVEHLSTDVKHLNKYCKDQRAIYSGATGGNYADLH